MVAKKIVVVIVHPDAPAVAAGRQGGVLVGKSKIMLADCAIVSSASARMKANSM